MAEPETQNEMAVLLPEVEIGGYVIKPWSFGRFKQVFPAVAGQLIPALKAAGVTLENAGEVLAEQGPAIIGAILPALTPLIAATLDISEAEVDALDFDQAAAIGLTIIAQNVGRLKNSLPLITAQIGAVVRGV